MQCPSNNTEITYMYACIERLEGGIWRSAILNSADQFSIIKGCDTLNLCPDDSMEILKITGTTVLQIYQKVIGTSHLLQLLLFLVFCLPVFVYFVSYDAVNEIYYNILYHSSCDY